MCARHSDLQRNSPGVPEGKTIHVLSSFANRASVRLRAFRNCGHLRSVFTAAAANLYSSGVSSAYLCQGQVLPVIGNVAIVHLELWLQLERPLSWTRSWLYADTIPIPVERPTAQSGRCWRMLASQQSTRKVEAAVEELIIRSSATKIQQLGISCL